MATTVRSSQGVDWLVSKLISLGDPIMKVDSVKDEHSFSTRVRVLFKSLHENRSIQYALDESSDNMKSIQYFEHIYHEMVNKIQEDLNREFENDLEDEGAEPWNSKAIEMQIKAQAVMAEHGLINSSTANPPMPLPPLSEFNKS